MPRIPTVAIALALVVAACSGGDEAAIAPETSVVASSAASTTAEATDPSTPDTPSFAGTTPAPEFPDGLDWINTPGPLTFDALRGKVVLLDFWTYGCINCIHIIPDLERLEAEFEEELVVIGVHSAKFTTEGETDNIRQVVLRYELEHPVVNDRDFEVWRAWGAQAWPTTVLIDPAGNVVGGHSGEGVYDVIAPVVASLVDEFDATGALDRSPLELTPITEMAAETVLSFPGKVLASPDGSRLYIADTGHHRIVAIDPTTGEALAVYGSGRSGFADGAAQEARFDAPQGMAFSPDGSSLYVADTDNHAIRSIDLATGNVATLAGTGALGWPPSAGPATEVSLNSPWDLVERDGILWIAMAGTHQLWSMDLAAGSVEPRVGSAREGTANGPFPTAELAQPSGVAFDGEGRLFFADSESSAIRYADIAIAETGLAAGSDANLFDFGDVDGVGDEARLQHPLGVAYWSEGDRVLVADTYNSKIKTIDPETLSIETFLGLEQGWADGDADAARFFEPGGIDILGSTMYVADTNNHAIRVVDLAGGEVGTIVIGGIERFSPPPDDADYRGTIIDLEDVTLAAGDGEFLLDIRLPDGYKVNDQAPSSVIWSIGGSAVDLTETDHVLTGVTFPVSIPATFVEGGGQVTADLTVIYCRDDAESLCLIEQVRFMGPMAVVTGGTSSVVLTHEVVVPDL